jgi:hypothetical protein
METHYGATLESNMRENYIARLKREADEARAQLAAVNEELSHLLTYLESSKFQGFDNDYVYVSTDIAPKLMKLRALAIN